MLSRLTAVQPNQWNPYLNSATTAVPTALASEYRTVAAVQQAPSQAAVTHISPAGDSLEIRFGQAKPQLIQNNWLKRLQSQNLLNQNNTEQSIISKTPHSNGGVNFSLGMASQAPHLFGSRRVWEV
ncbi:MAG: hypothetical protein SFZ03_11025 [Candidatus Melainabacteria bacterium]|nr:hypothetical protein [Candidatus Melainabacteria bacterium]